MKNELSFVESFLGWGDQFTAKNMLDNIKGVVYGAVLTAAGIFLAHNNNRLSGCLLIVLGFILFILFEVKIILLCVRSTLEKFKGLKTYMILNFLFVLFIVFTMGGLYLATLDETALKYDGARVHQLP
jgi:hypothetical protein